MAKRNEEKADRDFENALAEKLMEKLVAEIPEPMFEAETENYVRDYDNRLRQSGLDLNTYFKYTGLTMEGLRAEMRPQAEKQVKIRLALEKIASLESITVSDEEIEAEYNRISEAYNVPVENVKGMVMADDIKADLLVASAMKLVKENAKVAAKKTAAKKTAEGNAEEKAAAPKATGAKKASTAKSGEAAKKTTTKKTTTKKTTAKKSSAKKKEADA